MRIIGILQNRFIIIPLALGLLLPCVAFMVIRASRLTDSRSQLVLNDAVVISGEPLPKSDLFDIDGSSITPGLLRSGKVFLVFFTTNCPACQKEMKLISRVTPDLPDKIKIYGISFQNMNEIRSFLRDNGVTANILVDKHGVLMESLKVKYFPTKFLLQDGIILTTFFGNSQDEADLRSQMGF